MNCEQSSSGVYSRRGWRECKNPAITEIDGKGACLQCALREYAVRGAQFVGLDDQKKAIDEIKREVGDFQFGAHWEHYIKKAIEVTNATH